MKRIVATIVFGAIAALAISQAPFTIVRPLDGAKVRESVRVQVPASSIQAGQYVGVFLDGKFLEARVLDLNGKFYEYWLDTKGRGIQDGNHKLELVLYAETADKPRIMDRTSIDFMVANSASIPVPSNGFLLRYKFLTGRQFPYLIEQKVKVSTISEAQAKMGGRAATLNVDGETFRMLYSIDDKYSNGDGLVRMQALPNRGRDFAMLTIFGEEEAKKYYAYEMHPIYMRITNTGFEKFGSVPFYVPMEGTAGEPVKTDLYAAVPLPSLPTKRVRPGDSWASRFTYGRLDMDNLYRQDSVTQLAPARGELLGVEWEMGHPCAKIRHSITVGSAGVPGINKIRDNMGSDKVSVEETFWFAMDLGMPIKIVQDLQIDTKIVDAPASGGAGPAAGGGGAGTDSGPTMKAGGAGQAGGSDRQIRPASGLNQKSGPGGDGGRPGGGRPGGGLSQGGGPTGGRLGGGPTGGRTGGPTVGAVRYQRFRLQRIQTLDL